MVKLGGDVSNITVALKALLRTAAMLLIDLLILETYPTQHIDVH